jgi:hypothetical protein
VRLPVSCAAHVGLPIDAVQLVETREHIAALLSMDTYIDVRCGAVWCGVVTKMWCDHVWVLPVYLNMPGTWGVGTLFSVAVQHIQSQACTLLIDTILLPHYPGIDV